MEPGCYFIDLLIQPALEVGVFGVEGLGLGGAALDPRGRALELGPGCYFLRSCSSAGGGGGLERG